MDHAEKTETAVGSELRATSWFSRQWPELNCQILRGLAHRVDYQRPAINGSSFVFSAPVSATIARIQSLRCPSPSRSASISAEHAIDPEHAAGERPCDPPGASGRSRFNLAREGTPSSSLGPYLFQVSIAVSESALLAVSTSDDTNIYGIDPEHATGERVPDA
jgi:hypothetical protein